MEEWLAVNTSSFGIHSPEHKTVRGVRVEVFLSPYDVPDAIRGYYDASIKRFVIEFKYIANEPIVLHSSDKHLSLGIGKNSGRLYKIEIGVDELKAKSVELHLALPSRVDQAIQGLEKSHADRKDNYNLARTILRDSQEAIIGQLQS